MYNTTTREHRLNGLYLVLESRLPSSFIVYVLVISTKSYSSKALFHIALDGASAPSAKHYSGTVYYGKTEVYGSSLETKK